MGLRTLSVTEVSNYVANVFEAEEMLHDISVRGEVSGFQIKSGIAYFSLKDSNCIISCIAFGAEKFGEIKNGDDVLAVGTVRYYAKGGRLNFNVYKLEPYGMGDIYKQFLLLKEKLEKEGLFDVKHKKPLPENIKTIGVVSSSTGAVIHDIIDVSTRRNPSINIKLFPAKVQGEGADLTIIEGLEYFENTDVDVVIVARGGGSYEDLQPFNSEALARKVYECNKVVVSAVGHETDYTIIDFVADLRAPTPSAAAEIVTQDVLVLRQKIENLRYDLVSNFENLVNKKLELLQENKDLMLENFTDSIDTKKSYVLAKSEALVMLKDNIYAKKEAKTKMLTKLLDSLNPLHILMKGYSKIYKSDKNIKSVKDLNVGDAVSIELIDGKAVANITGVEV